MSLFILFTGRGGTAPPATRAFTTNKIINSVSLFIRYTLKLLIPIRSLSFSIQAIEVLMGTTSFCYVSVVTHVRCLWQHDFTDKKKTRAGITDYGQLLDQDGEMYDVPSFTVLLEN